MFHSWSNTLPGIREVSLLIICISLDTGEFGEIYKFVPKLINVNFFGSVGAHISGLVANHIKPKEGKIGRITGLDPTIFFYGGAGNNSRDLDPSDAHFVDILHTGKQQSSHINYSTF